MALGPILNELSEVMRFPGEFLVLVRPHCEFELVLENIGKVSGSGHVQLRLTFPGCADVFPSRPRKHRPDYESYMDWNRSSHDSRLQ